MVREHKTVKALVLELIEGKIQELERKGVLAKGKPKKEEERQ